MSDIERHCQHPVSTFKHSQRVLEASPRPSCSKICAMVVQGIQRGREMAAAALQSPIPERFDDVSALQSFSEDSIVQEGHMQALIREQRETFALAQYGIREVLL